MRNSIWSFQAMWGRMQILVTHTWFPIMTFQFTTYKILKKDVLKCLSSSFLSFEREINDICHIVLKIELDNYTNL